MISRDAGRVDAVDRQDGLVGLVLGQLGQGVAAGSERVLGVDPPAQQNDAKRRVIAQFHGDGQGIGQDVQPLTATQGDGGQERRRAGIDQERLAVGDKLRSSGRDLLLGLGMCLFLLQVAALGQVQDRGDRPARHAFQQSVLLQDLQVMADGHFRHGQFPAQLLDPDAAGAGQLLQDHPPAFVDAQTFRCHAHPSRQRLLFSFSPTAPPGWIKANCSLL